MAPSGVRNGLLEQIGYEIDHHRAGRPAHIRMKVNSLVDETVIDALFEASRAGVPIDIVARGISALRPGVPGLSETIKVRSILGRFLEHSRVFWFAGGGQPRAWIGSADLMHRNLDRRVEALAQIPSGSHVREVGELMDLDLADTTSAWYLQPDVTWVRRHHADDGPRSTTCRRR